MISIVGLGPGDPGLITRRAWDLLTGAPDVWVRTRQHPAVEVLAGYTQVHSYDHIYEQMHDFQAVYSTIAADVVQRGFMHEMVYAVPGDPSVAEATTHLIASLATEKGVPFQILAGVSFLEPSFAALGIDPVTGVQIIDAMDLATTHHPLGSTQQGMLVVQLYSRALASDVKLTLMNAYSSHHQVAQVRGAGGTHQRVRWLPLFELDRHEDYDDYTSLWVPARSDPADYNNLQDVIAHLRAPDGCPWDREQTHESLRPYLLEETYEVLEALDTGDAHSLAEELGDLLIQVALHVQIATEEGDFQLADVIGHVVQKLIRRHPHVFAEVDVADAAEVARNWEAIKQEERRAHVEKADRSLLDGIPIALPALSLAQTYIERLARVGYPLPALRMMTETVLANQLIDLIEAAEVVGLDAEASLRQRCATLRERCHQVEAAVRHRGSLLTDLSPDEQAELWGAGFSGFADGI